MVRQVGLGLDEGPPRRDERGGPGGHIVGGVVSWQDVDVDVRGVHVERARVRVITRARARVRARGRARERELGRVSECERARGREREQGEEPASQCRAGPRVNLSKARTTTPALPTLPLGVPCWKRWFRPRAIRVAISGSSNADQRYTLLQAVCWGVFDEHGTLPVNALDTSG